MIDRDGRRWGRHRGPVVVPEQADRGLDRFLGVLLAYEVGGEGLHASECCLSAVDRGSVPTTRQLERRQDASLSAQE